MEGHDPAEMANRIAAYFEAYPQAEAEAGVAEHIRLFWDPRLRAALRARLEDSPAAFAPLARAGAVRALTPEGPQS